MSGQPGNLAPGQPHELSVDSCDAPLCELEKAILRGMGSVPNRTSYELHLPAQVNAQLRMGWAEPNSDGERTVNGRSANG
jgi:hypothetical protein